MLALMQFLLHYSSFPTLVQNSRTSLKRPPDNQKPPKVAMYSADNEACINLESPLYCNPQSIELTTFERRDIALPTHVVTCQVHHCRLLRGREPDPFTREENNSKENKSTGCAQRKHKSGKAMSKKKNAKRRDDTIKLQQEMDSVDTEEKQALLSSEHVILGVEDKVNSIIEQSSVASRRSKRFYLENFSE
ncbi:hypothetical protein DV515_00010890, partial [Chloebia gouldiae]